MNDALTSIFNRYMTTTSRGGPTSSTIDGDDSSVSSTFTAEESKPLILNDDDASASSPKSPSCPKPRKAVTIDEGANQYYDNALWCYEDCAEQWFDRESYAHFKMTNNVLAREIRHMATVPTRPGVTTYHNTLERAFAACADADGDEADAEILTSEHATALAKWLEIAHARHGLERLGSRAISMDRVQRRQALLQAVRCLQTNSITGASSWFFSASDRQELMRKTCEPLTRPSRLFAQQLGKAQASFTL